MSIDIQREGDLTPAEWNSLVDRAHQADAMHQWGALETMAEHTDSTLHPLVGYKGQEPVGIFPVFERRFGPVRTVFSPPPALRVVYLGPALLNMDKLKQRKAERRHRRFLDGVSEWIEDTIDPTYAHLRTTPGYPDVRPFTWSGHTVSPTYTYHVDITGSESDVLGRFSRDARSNVTNAADYEVAERGIDAIDRVLEQVRGRYESQGVSFDVTTAFVRDLYERTPEGTVRPYTCRREGSFVGGIVAFEFDGTIARWQGGVKPDDDSGFPTNDVLDWELMLAGREHGCDTYDLVGADNPRINRYKSKFGPDLVGFYDVERSTLLGSLAARVYKRTK